MHSSKLKIWDSYSSSIASNDHSGVIVRIAENLDVAPCLVAKIILHKYFEENYNKDNEEQQPVTNVNVYLRDTTLISDPRLAYEVYLVGLKFFFSFKCKFNKNMFLVHFVW